MRLETTAIATHRRPFNTLLWRVVVPARIGLACTPVAAPRRCRAGDRRSWRRGFGRRRSSWETAGDAGCKVIPDAALASPVPSALKAARQSPAGPESEVGREILQGTAIGLASSLILAWLAGGSRLIVEFAALWGSCVGALIGLLLWVGSDDVPEDPVVPPPGQKKSQKKWNKPRTRR